MAIVNGTLKYKQDDGTLVELGPVGMDERARTLATAAGQTANNAQTAAENVQQTVNNIATQIQLIEQTTGYNASPEDVPATSMKASINALNTKVKALESAGAKTVYNIPVVGSITDFFNHGFIVTIPMPENLLSALINGKSFSSAVLKKLGGAEGNAILNGYKRNGTPFTLQIPTNTKVGVSRSFTLLEYRYVNNDMDFNANDYGGVNVYASSSIVVNGGVIVEVTLN